MFEIQKSGDKTSSGEIGLDIRTHASPKVGQDQVFGVEWSGIGCLTSQLTIFQSYMWRHIDVQADWRRSWTYGRAPNAIDIS